MEPAAHRAPDDADPAAGALALLAWAMRAADAIAAGERADGRERPVPGRTVPEYGRLALAVTRPLPPRRTGPAPAIRLGGSAA